MKINTKILKRTVAIIGVVLGLAVAPIPRAFADVSPTDASPQKAITPSQAVFGMTYGDWSAAWWQYVLSIPNSTNPILDTTGANCGVGQSSGPVFFLVGAGTDPVTRTCTVSSKKAFFFPIINSECSTVEDPPYHGDNAQELRTCAGGFTDGVDINSLKVIIDGKKLHDLESFRVQSPLFEFVTPSSDNLLGLDGVTSGSSTSDGYWIMLKPLSPGNHKLHFEAKVTSGPGAGFSQNVTYKLTVTE